MQVHSLVCNGLEQFTYLYPAYNYFGCFPDLSICFEKDLFLDGYPLFTPFRIDTKQAFKMVQNKGLIFKEVPTHWPELGKHLVVENRDFDTDQAPPEGGFTAKVNYVSFDPYQRGRMRAPEAKSYSPPFELGKPITNSGIVTVIKSDNSNFKEGDVVKVPLASIEEYTAVSKGMADGSNLLKNPYNLDEKHFIASLGMPGLTAYSSFYAIGEPKKGETIFISAASGAVGQIVGQLAKHEGLKVIGSVGDDKKLEFIEKDLKFDGGFNYKKEDANDALQRLAPNGIDIYYENVSTRLTQAMVILFAN